MESSRKRLRPNLEEASSEMCVHCGGTGRIRNKESAALHVLRAIENEGYKGRNSVLSVALNPEVAFYVLNSKRQDLISLENKYGIQVELTGNSALISPNYEITSSGKAPAKSNVVKLPPVDNSVSAEKVEESSQSPDADENADKKPRRRRRRGGRGRGKYGRNRFQDDENTENKTENKTENGENKPEGEASSQTPDDTTKTADGEQKQPRRRGTRGGKRSRYSRGGEKKTDNQKKQNAGDNANTPAPTVDAVKVEGEQKPQSETPEAKKPARRSRKKPQVEAKVDVKVENTEADAAKEEKPKTQTKG